MAQYDNEIHVKPSFVDMFNSEEFREIGHQLIDLLSHHLNQQTNRKRPVINWREPVAENSNWQKALPTNPTLNAAGLLQTLESTILNNSLAIHHPRNMGHQVAPPLPIAALCDLVAALTNQAMAVYEAGPSATMLERQLVAWLCELIGWKTEGSTSHGFLTSGGAQANLTALLAARQVAGKKHTKTNIWQDGIRETKLRILASEHTHYSISRAAGIMGFGTDAVIKVSCDEEGGMDISSLKKVHQECLRSNQIIIAVVATAGCTATGSIDPLLAIGQYCQVHRLWLHVDGAHGASALLSPQHKHKVKGIDLADSVVWDGHKLLYMPAAVSAVLFKDGQNSYAAFAQEASYLFAEGDEQEYNNSYRTLECTKRMMGLKIWAAFSLYGTHGLSTLLDNVFAKAQLFAEKIMAQDGFELLMTPQTNIVCFRYIAVNSSTKHTDTELNQRQTYIRQIVVKSGAFHITQVEYGGKLWLRTSIMNPLTTTEDFDALLLLIMSIKLKKYRH